MVRGPRWLSELRDAARLLESGASPVPEALPVSNSSTSPTSMTLVSDSRDRASHAARSALVRDAHTPPDIAAIRRVLAPEERLVALLQGVDRGGMLCWAITPRRLVVLPDSGRDEQVVQVPHAAITCVEMRTDPLGTWLRVRATGRQLALHTLDAASAAEFCTLLRERAGIGGAMPHVGSGATAPALPGFSTPPRLRQLR